MIFQEQNVEFKIILQLYPRIVRNKKKILLVWTFRWDPRLERPLDKRKESIR